MSVKSFDKEIIDAEINANLYGNGGAAAEDRRPELKPLQRRTETKSRPTS
ncbi:MAG: hypothetical protein LBU32_04265 [Clostridiales bacterium]|jgi:hypothetical protein|nr:hypothetical protein [Clostridiales bacterium]